MKSSDFEQWCHRLQLLVSTRDFMARLLSPPLTRRMQDLAQNVGGTYSSRKMGVTIQFESHKVELERGVIL